ncbi:MAG TPA: sigma-70 family RNA polymerase sigma factor, partial [Gemmatimonadales bacterium]|nr:sigma-70 family RNA polymerase sigma factor [Gemmatimonadales bacterium]
FAYLYVRSRETAEELVQDVFVRLWERHEAIAEVRAYLFRAVRNAALTWLRHHRIERRLELAPEDGAPPGMGAPVRPADATVESAELRAAVRRAVAGLPEPYREVLTLRTQHQLSYPEIAAVLDIPLKTVETRVTRAFKALREVLAVHR